MQFKANKRWIQQVNQPHRRHSIFTWKIQNVENSNGKNHETYTQSKGNQALWIGMVTRVLTDQSQVELNLKNCSSSCQWFVVHHSPVLEPQPTLTPLKVLQQENKSRKKPPAQNSCRNSSWHSTRTLKESLKEFLNLGWERGRSSRVAKVV